ncbi:MAG: hypothetical protein PHE93_05600 [Clostridia bacterium]|nr:hypothetical protein [Clostridia bacterium]
MAFNPNMLPMLMSMMGKNGSENENGGFDVETISKLISGMQGGDASSLLSMLPQNDKTKGFMDMAKNIPALMSMMGNGASTNASTQNTDTQNNANYENNAQSENKTNVFSADNPFKAVNGFCGNEVNSALSKLFNNK